MGHAIAAGVSISTISGSGGELHELDALITATAFCFTEKPVAKYVHGGGGATLSGAYLGDLANYKGTMFPGFPNLFALRGPNTAFGYSSIIFMVESRLNYVTKAVRTALKESVLIEPKPYIAAQWTREL
ncbi:MAG: hypothetical protein ACYCPT_06475 [Acidimicrobiales bacterium]